MKYPLLEIDYEKLVENVRVINGIAQSKNIEIAGVTKVFCAIPEIAQAYVDGGLDFLADSRIKNLKRLRDINCRKMMIRLPMISEADDVVTYSDMSLNSEIATVRALNKAAEKAGKIHDVIIMQDLGDLREGYYDEYELFHDVEEIISMKNIRMAGVGVNLTCFGGVIPDEYNIFRLVSMAKYLKTKYNLNISMVSGGNSSSLHMLIRDELVEGVTNLRIGEAFVLGRETAYGERIEGTNQDVFKLKLEIIEVKKKPTVPKGILGKNAFGEIPIFEDRGMRRVAICAIGKQDLDISKITPLDDKIRILGGSSDHLVLDLTDSETTYQVGDILEFGLSYGGLLGAMSSQYVTKLLIKKDEEIVLSEYR